jgi:hypothetical protein
MSIDRGTNVHRIQYAIEGDPGVLRYSTSDGAAGDDGNHITRSLTKYNKLAHMLCIILE